MIDHQVLLATNVLNALTEEIAVLDANGTIVFVNDAWNRFSAVSRGAPQPDAYLGVNYLSVCRDAVGRGDAAAEQALASLEDVLQARRKEATFEYPCHAPDRERWYVMSVTRFGGEHAPYLVVAHQEITARKQAERALQENERLLRTVLESLPVGVWVMDARGRIVHGNAASLRIWAGARYVGPEEFGAYKGWWLSTGKPIAADEWAAARAIRNGETSLDEEIEIECFDTTHKIILNSALPLYDAGGERIGAVILNQDITDRKRAEAEREAMLEEKARLRTAAVKASRMKDEFIASLSHELRTPLQAVLGWAATIRQGVNDPVLCQRAAAAIERNARIQAQLLDDTLDVSRIVHGTLTIDEVNVDFAALVAEVIESLRPTALEKGLNVVEHASPGADVQGDPIRLQQVVWNLLNNAMKFTPPGGRIDVATGVRDGWVELSIHDTGRGIAPEFIPFLFDRFRQGGGSPVLTRLGLGLGLAIVKELVERHKGTITAGSPGEGQGATFTVRLPVATGTRARSERGDAGV